MISLKTAGCRIGVLCLIPLLILSFIPVVSAEEMSGEFEGVAVDEITRILDYEFVDGVLVVELESDLSQTVRVVDSLVGIGDGGVTQVPVQSFLLDRGHNTIEVEVVEYRGDFAVSISTSRGMAMISGDSGFLLFSGDADWSYVQVAGVSGFLSTLVLLGVLAYKKKGEEGEDVFQRY
ncbi:Spindle-shaped halovirus associated protein [Methanonatronarchaeum thermophilum]|uniref:Spindle-shaped halovirus associated protein n=1 Tax=Methanonatronarchaeum thermophilum TaxID=1927129 RepID=A0A1Y3GBV8_9EURY|nr:hypothetical protein [Methanonatronarchaeum thermophilum]OUJ18908.1 Spindle-shaped halovirus associated protein [Methanonatronarchaeum thermophilum]